MYDEDTSFGIAVFLPNCSFEVEIPRIGIEKSIQQIDEFLDEKGISEEIEERIIEIIGNASNISSDMANGLIDAETATAELAYNFVYAFVKKNKNSIPKTRGIIGVVQNDQLYIEGYTDQKSYRDCTDTLKSMSGSDETEDLTPIKPTIH
jgi:hypothetical protein